MAEDIETKAETRKSKASTATANGDSDMAGMEGKIDPRKMKALDMALSNIEKQFGKGSVVRLGQSTRLNIDAISTGSIALDMALGIGGIPRGRITEIYGAESSGKTTIALQCVAQAQKIGGVCAYIDVEHAIDPEYARNLGVDVDNLFISQPATGEEALDIMDALIRSSAIDIVVLDSVAALVPKAELEGDMGDSHVGATRSPDVASPAKSGGKH